MARLHKPALERLAAYLKDEGRTEPSLKDVIALAELTADSLQGFYARLDGKLYGELVEIGRYITAMRQDVAALGADEIRRDRLPSAGHELDEIVKSTEEATNTIMNCAEAILGADASDVEAYQTTVQDAAMRIFEACAFQDLTGQRVAKVVETLQAIEARVARFAKAVRVEGAAETSDEERAREARKRNLILNGPQAKGVAIEQNAVDALFGGSAADQDAIDKLFA